MDIATREAYGLALRDLGKINENVVVLEGDLSGSTRTIYFKREFPERFFEMGISEQDMMSTAAGFATCGSIPFASTFAVFATGRPYDQIRVSIAYPKLNVKIAASHAGISVGADGATHESIDDIALMRALPNMTVICPSDAVETRKAVLAAAEHRGPVYIRLGRMPVPVIHSENYKYQIGRGETLKEGSDAAIIATGIMVSKALEAAELLEREGIRTTVVNIHTIKPIDRDLIINTAKRTKKIVTVEEHSVIGGLGSAVCEVLSQSYPTRVKILGINDMFGQSGTPGELFKFYGLTVEDIVQSVKNL